MTETDWNALAEMCEAAGADEQRALLEAAFALIVGDPHGFLRGEADRVRIRFLRKLDAEAFESAAMMLVPEGWQLDQLGEWYEPVVRAQGPWLAILIERLPRMNDGGSGGPADPYARCSHAATPALALLAACCRARGQAASGGLDHG